VPRGLSGLWYRRTDWGWSESSKILDSMGEIVSGHAPHWTVQEAVMSRIFTTTDGRFRVAGARVDPRHLMSGRFRRHHCFVTACVLATAFLLLAGSPAAAAPIVDYPIGPANEAVFDLAPGLDGSMWFVESVTSTSNAYSVGEVDANGNLLVRASMTLPPGADGSADVGADEQLVSASDGGVWALAPGVEGLSHVSPDGSVQPVSTPAGMDLLDVAAGDDGNAWLLGCTDDQASASESCDALSVSNTGQITSYALPSRSGTLGGVGGGMFVTSGGVWMNAVFLNGQPVSSAAFVSYSGEVTPALIPGDAAIVGDASAGNAWWEEPPGSQPDTTPTVTFGQVTPSGASSTVLQHDQATTDPLAFTSIAAGLNGDLVWSEGTPSSTSQTGFVGTFTSHGQTSFTVPEDAAAIPPPPGSNTGAWSGSCDFGGELYQAANGDIWVVSAGHPERISVLTPSGVFSTFLPVPWLGQDFMIWGMQPSSTGALWYSIDLPDVTSTTSALLARADPLNPPPGEPAYPGSRSGTGTEGSNPGKTKAGKPTVSHVSFKGIANRKPRLVFTVDAGKRAEPLKSIVVDLPSGLSFSRTPKPLKAGISVSGTTGKVLNFRLGLTRNTARIALVDTATSVHIAITEPPLRVSKRLARKVKRNEVRSLSLIVLVTDSSKATTRIALDRLKLR
jgi:hypothetical protein